MHLAASMIQVTIIHLALYNNHSLTPSIWYTTLDVNTLTITPSRMWFLFCFVLFFSCWKLAIKYIPTLYCEFVEQKNIHTFLSCLTLPETTPRNSYTGDETSSHVNTAVVLWPMYITIVFNSQFSTRKKKHN
jgi:hypothetical protein